MIYVPVFVLVVLVLIALAAAYYANCKRQDLAREKQVTTIFENRAKTLRGDNDALVASNEAHRVESARLVVERDSAVRELGRVRAELVAAKRATPCQPEPGTIILTPKRGADGRFLPKPKADKPIACG